MKRPFRWLLVLAVIGAVVLGVEYGLRVRDANETLEESERIERRMLEEEMARDGRRPALGGIAGDGDAREIYEAVMPLMSDLREEDQETLDLLQYSAGLYEEVSLGDVEALITATGPLLDRLRPVLTTSRMSPRHALQQPAPDVEAVEHLGAFSRIVSVHLRHHVNSDRVGEAIDLCMMRWFAGYDYGRHGSLIGYLVGMALASTSVEELRWILADCVVPAERLDRLAREIETLRSSTPDVLDAWRVEEMYTRFMVREGGREAGLLYTNRLLCAEALRGMTSAREAVAAAIDGKSGRAAFEAAEAELEKLNADDNPLLQMIIVVYPITVRRGFEVAALGDMLRVNVALARYREQHGHKADHLTTLVPELLPEIPVCAYSGEALRYDGDKLWSIGADGDDDGGDPPLSYDDGIGHWEEGDAVFTLRPRMLHAFPWPDEVSLEERGYVESAIVRLFETGKRDAFRDSERKICGRLISEFKKIEDGPGFDDVEARKKVAQLDQVLRSIDGVMERRWWHMYAGVGDDTAAYARRTAQRWTSWWYRKQWLTDPTEPWAPDEVEDGD